MRTALTEKERSALRDLVKHGELLCFEGCHWAEIGFERDPSKFPNVVPLVSHRTAAIKMLVALGYATYGLGRRRVSPTKEGRMQVPK